MGRNNQSLVLNNTELIKLAVAGVAGYYLLGKRLIGAFVGLAVLMLLVKGGQQPLMQNNSQAV